MNLQLKKAIFNYMVDNSTTSQLVNATKNQFRQYIYTPEGEYCIGGETVALFIDLIYKTIFI